jgi:hypothetical protein
LRCRFRNLNRSTPRIEPVAGKIDRILKRNEGIFTEWRVDLLVAIEPYDLKRTSKSPGGKPGR